MMKTMSGGTGVGRVAVLGAGVVALACPVVWAAPARSGEAKPPFPDALELSGAWQSCVWGSSPKAKGSRPRNVDARKLAGLPEEIAVPAGKGKYTIMQWGDCRLAFELRGKARVKLLNRYDVVELAAKAGARASASGWTRYDVRFVSPRWKGGRPAAVPRMEVSVGGRRLSRPISLSVPAEAPARQVNHTGEEFGRLAVEAGETDAALREVWVGPVEPMEPRPGEWRELFDGRTLSGWTKSGGNAHYEARDGEVVGVTRPNTPNTFLATEKDYGNFEFECEVWGELGFNGGIQFRSEPRDGRDKAKGTRGYQYELDPGGRAWSAGVYDEARRSWLHPLAFHPDRRMMFPGRKWHSVRIVAAGPVIRTYLDGRPVAQLYDAMTLRGYFGLQVHSVGKKTEQMEIRFRKLRLRELRL